MLKLSEKERREVIARLERGETLPERFKTQLFAPKAKQSPAKAVKSVTLLVPVCNEEASIPIFFEEILPILRGLQPQVQPSILFINDGSRDATEAVIRAQAARSDLPVKLVCLSRNFGKEAALAAGLAQSDSDAVIPIDVDLQDDPSVIPAMIAAWFKGAKVVNAKRSDRSSDSFFKRKFAENFYRIFNLLAEYPMPENVGDFRLLDREIVEILNSMPERARFNKGLFSWVGFETAEVSYVRQVRREGDSRWSFWKLWNFGLDGIFNTSTLPLRVWSYAGILMALLTFLYVVALIINVMVTGVDVPGYASTVVLIAFFGGINLLSVGLLGEYIGRIYREVRGRPLYIVQSVWQGEGDAPSRQGQDKDL